MEVIIKGGGIKSVEKRVVSNNLYQKYICIVANENLHCCKIKFAWLQKKCIVAQIFLGRKGYCAVGRITEMLTL